MKNLKYLFLLVGALSFASCSEDIMDDINKDKNNAAQIQAKLTLPHVIVESAAGTTATDMAWYSSVYIEHNAGTHGQFYTADKRTNTNESSLFNNSWNSLYQSALMPANDIIKKCSPGGTEADNTRLLGIAQILIAYNWAVTTDMWGDIPFSEALQGSLNRQPKYDSQEAVYTGIQKLLDDAIVNLTASLTSANTILTYDYIYGGDAAKWIKAANSLKARYYLRLSNKDASAAQKALAAAAKGFTSAADAFVFAKYEATAIGENPWYQFFVDRSATSVGKTLYDLMVARNDPRVNYYFTLKSGVIVPAPNGTATESQNATYSVSKIASELRTNPTPLMSYHELLFVIAEAKFRASDATYTTDLKNAITASFAWHKVTESAATYYTANVEPKLATAALEEILTQKYIAGYEIESIEAYNDYRRTGFPTMKNPNNNLAAYGFVNRFPYPTTEESYNSANVPSINSFKDKVWWAK